MDESYVKEFYGGGASGSLCRGKILTRRSGYGDAAGTLRGIVAGIRADWRSILITNASGIDPDVEE
jgi:hypothetical protein